jgi:GAF domain-containing protein
MMVWVMEPSPSRDQVLSTMANAASTHFPSQVGFPGENSAHSLIELARRDLDAALQLLTDRAQYITGASGAAIALRRNGKNDMQCRASTGTNAPELGALLSTEFGLSGESVRTRQPLRCDDAERDVRVNREVCRQLGIASVVVMPVVNEEEVLGVFELFSGEVNAFGERDLSAVQRLSEMVETAVRLAEATENLTERLRAGGISALAVAAAEAEEDKILDVPVLESLAPHNQVPAKQVVEELVLEDVVLTEPGPELAAEAIAGKQLSVGSTVEVAETNGEDATSELLDEKIPTPSTHSGQALKPEEGAPSFGEAVAAVPDPAKAAVPESVAFEPQAASPQPEAAVAPSPETTPSKNQLFWSAALNPAADAAKPAEVDQSRVPPVLRNLRKCEACGFPVSTGRVLCVECEEKKWRGQLKAPHAGARVAMSTPAAIGPRIEARVFTAAASASATSTVGQTSPAVEWKESKPAEQRGISQLPAASSPPRQAALKPSARTLKASSPEFVLSSGLEPSQSWLSANKYILMAVLVVGLIVAAVFFLH